MNLNFNTINISSVCEGCLSTDRKLSVVYDNLVRELFSNLVGKLEYISNPLALCWECIAIHRKIVRYKRRVQNAHKHLVSYVLQQTNILPSLSNLSTHKTQEPIVFHWDKVDDCISYNNAEIDEKYSNMHMSHNVTEIAKGGRETQDPVDEKEREPVFIKIENEGNDNFEQELDNGDDFDNHYADDVDDLDLKRVLKSTTKLKKSKNKADSEFNDSDDEPLKKTKESKGKRKKKERDKRSSRERPSGIVQSSCAKRTLDKLGLPPGLMQAVRLSWQEVEEERQKALTSSSYLRHAHRCEDCAIGFNHRSKLQNHMNKHAASAGDLVCSVCKIRCQTQHALTAHKRRHRIRWRCCACGELGSRAAVVADHCARAHGAATPRHQCAVCGHVAETLSKLRNHLKNHAERQKCDLCDKTFRDRSTLNTHLFIHKGEKEHACPVCGKLFLFKKAMQLHHATHAANEMLYCHQCDMNFKNQMSYYQHMKYNLKHVDPARLKYSCTECGKRFMKASRLNEHTTAVHLKLTPVPCTEDGCAFNKRTLEGHLRSHTGERPHACARCAATFNYRAALHNHTRLVHAHAHKTSRDTTAADNTAWQATALTLEPNTELT